MKERETINQYDVVEVILVPEQYKGIIDIGDTGVVVEKHDDENFEVECIQPGGSSRWLEKLNIRHVKLRSKDPYHRWIASMLPVRPIMRTSVLLGVAVGAGFGGLIGAGLGAIAMTWTGIIVGMLVGLVLGAITGALTAALTAKAAGTTGGIGVGYFVGMLFGGVFGMFLGVLIPTSWRESAHTEGLPVIDALVMGRFETAILLSFLLSILATIVGIWIGGKNYVPRNLKERYRS